METSNDQLPDRGAVLRGGLVGALVGAGLLALAVFFLFRLDEPADLLGVFIPLSVGLVAAALGTMALVPLRWGDGPEAGVVIARFFRGLAVGGLVLTVAGVARGELPWIAFALLPLLACGALVRESGRFARLPAR
ncbi:MULTISPECIES: hypothetical protein [Nocardioides]|uniref:hypothetical protein n=1 Tax=Nocardioides TaxID=1839 RepID=UPI000C7830A0|nr:MULTISPECIES: hypothetical protein [Nocardioides]